MTTKGRNDSDLTGSLAKGLAVLGSFSPDNPSMSVSEIAARVDLNRATAYRIASVLASLGFLEQVQRQGGHREYRPGLKVLLLGRAALESLDLPELALPYLQELQHRYRETVNMAILDGGSIVYILRLKTDNMLNIRLFVGSRLPAHCTSMGKAMLAFLPDDELDRIAASLDFTQLTDQSIANLVQLRNELDKVRQRGFALNDQEVAIGLRSVGAPIFLHKRVVAAISIAIPSGRMAYARLLQDLGPAVRNTAQRISNYLGERSTELISAPKTIERTGSS